MPAPRTRVSALLVAATVVAAAIGAAGILGERQTLAGAGLAAATAFAAAFGLFLVVSDRRRRESAKDRLQEEASFLESLVASITVVSAAHEPDEILGRTCSEARTLFGARSARIIPADGTPVSDAHPIEDGIRVPLRTGDTPIGTLELRRPDPFPRVDVVRAQVLADAASRAVENARLFAEAREREAERARLTERLITAEQDERRRLSIFLHDGPLQSMSGIALMHDAALAAIEDGRYEEAARVVANALERERDTIRVLRDLSFAIEPIVLRDQGFVAAVDAIAEQIESAHGITVEATVGAGERLGEKAQVALYQVIREALDQAVMRQPTRIMISLDFDGERFTTVIEDDGVGERRRAGIAELDERVRVLSGRVSVDAREKAGTSVRVVLPAYASTPTR